MLRQLLAPDSEMNNNINGVALTTPMDAFHWGQFPGNSTVAGTSELFSSTFAMLSGDPTGSFQDQWVEQKPATFANPLFFDQPTQSTPIVPGLYEPSLDQSMARFDPPAVQYRTSMYNPAPQFVLPHYQQSLSLPTQHVQMPLPSQPKQEFLLPTVQTTIPQSIAHSPLPTSRHDTQCTASKMADRCATYNRRPSASPHNVSTNSPIVSNDSGREEASPNEENISTDLEGPDDVRVMCLACKGVYPSRRSLTGHIGRNEKCREIIDQVAAGANPIAPGTESALKAGALTNGQDGLSPVCPYCDRFISHYKGNIRRHINQCGKNSNSGPRRPRTDKDKERKRGRKRMDDGPPPILHEGFEPMPALNMGMNGSMMTYLPHMSDPSSNGSASVQLPSDPSPPNPPRKEADPPEDAYICGQCEFVTIYKGNMKRHLNTCHPAPDCKDLKEWDRKLESMRASALGISREEMLERLHAHKMNSTRGRKPRARNAQQQQQQQQQPIDNMSQQHVNHHQQQQQQQPQLSQMMMPSQDLSQPIHYSYEMGSGYL